METENKVKKLKEYDANRTFLLQEIKENQEIKKIISVNEILHNHLKRTYHKGKTIEVDSHLDNPEIKKYILINDINDDFLEITYYDLILKYETHEKLTKMKAPIETGIIKIPK